jgi:hypothetical protein
MTCIRGTGFGFGSAFCARVFVPIRNAKKTRTRIFLANRTLNMVELLLLFIKQPEKEVLLSA